MSLARHLVAGLLLVACAATGMQGALQQIHGSWMSAYGHFSHGYLVLAMACACLYVVIRRDGAGEPRPQWWFLPGVAVLALAQFVALQIGVAAISQSLVPLLLFAAVATVFGWQVGRRFLFPVALLLTAMPLWWVINAPLQWLTAKVANLAIQVSGIPAFVEGNQFHLPAGVVEVAAGCSGLNYLLTALSLAVFQAACFLRGRGNRLRLLLAAVAMALLCNWARVYALVVVGYLSGMRHYLITQDHLIFGWVLFLVAMWPVFLYGARLARSELPQVASGVPTVVWQPGAVRPLLPAAVVVAATLLLPRLLPALLHEQVSGLAVATGMAGSGETGLPLHVAGAREVRGLRHVAGVPVWVYQAMAGKADGHVDMPASVLDVLGRGYVVHQRRDGSAHGLPYEEYEGMQDGRRVLLRAGFIIAGEPAASPWQVKLAALKGLLALRAGEVLWALATPCEADCEQARMRLDGMTRMDGAGMGS